MSDLFWTGALGQLLDDRPHSEERVERVGDKLKEGESVRVKVLEVDRQGRVRLTMRDVEAG